MIFNMQEPSLFMHVVMIGIVVGIGILYIKPTVEVIGENQDTKATFAREVDRVSAVNTRLAQKVAEINAIPLDDRRKLATYLPDTLDSIAVMRTVESMMEGISITPTSLEFDGVATPAGQSESSASSLESGSISLSFETDEPSLFVFFSTIEQNEFPFIIKEASISPTDEGTISAEFVFTVFSLPVATSGVVSGTEFSDEEML